MKIPCKDCLILPICRAKSQNYSSHLRYINDEIFNSCIKKYLTWDSLEFILLVRWFLRADLKFTSPHSVDNDLIEKAKVIYYENTM